MSVDSMGRCGMLRDSDLEGLVMGMNVATRDDWGIRFDIEGMELKGNMDSARSCPRSFDRQQGFQ